jgi:hypothetical protein
MVFSRFANWLFYGSEPVDSAPAYGIPNTSLRSNNVGDIDKDGYDDFCVSGRNDLRKLNLYYGGPDADTVRDMWFGLDTLLALGYIVRGGDLNSDGNDELIAWELEDQKSVLFFELGTDSDSLPDFQLFAANDSLANSSFGYGLTGGDFNGDGRQDLAVSYIPNFNDFVNGAIYLYWGGPSFDTLPDMIIRRQGPYVEGKDAFGRVLENVGDLNGDTFDDLYAGAGVAADDSLGFVYFGGPSIDTIPDIILDTRDSRARAAGDVNNDGYDDMITSYPLPWTGIGHVAIYLGGPDVDSIPDVYFDIRDEQVLHELYGLDCSGIGDFNGDGIDDFAFSSGLGLGRYVVYIYSGWDESTDVLYEYLQEVPDGFQLSQNYPNPFNNETILEFALPARSHVGMDIINTLGQHVKTLLNRTLPAGSFRISWDGTNDDGQPVASGVYLYRLTAGETLITKKMTLIK